MLRWYWCGTFFKKKRKPPINSAAKNTLVRISVDEIGKLSESNQVAMTVFFINNSDSAVVVRDFLLLEIVYFDDMSSAKNHGSDRILDSERLSPLEFKPPLFARTTPQHWKDGDHELYQVRYLPKSINLNGTTQLPITIAANRTSEVQLTFATNFTPELIKGGATNAVAGALIIDILNNSGEIDRRVCRAFESIDLHFQMGISGIGFGPLGDQPLVLLPHGGSLFCETAKKD